MARGRTDEMIARAAEIRRHTGHAVWIFHVPAGSRVRGGYYIFDRDPYHMTYEEKMEVIHSQTGPLSSEKVDRELRQHESCHAFRVAALQDAASRLMAWISQTEEKVFDARQRLRDVQREHAKLTGKDV